MPQPVQAGTEVLVTTSASLTAGTLVPVAHRHTHKKRLFHMYIQKHIRYIRMFVPQLLGARYLLKGAVLVFSSLIVPVTERAGHGQYQPLAAGTEVPVPVTAIASRQAGTEVPSAGLAAGTTRSAS